MQPRMAKQQSCMNGVQGDLTYCSMVFLWKKKVKLVRPPKRLYIHFRNIALFRVKSRPNHILESSSPSTENLCDEAFSAIASSTSATAPTIVVKFLTMKNRNSILNLAFHARQFKCSMTKDLPVVMHIQRPTIPNNTVNKHYKHGKRIQWKIVDTD